MKRIASLLIVALCIFALTACDLLSYLPDSSDDKPEDNQPHVCEFTVESKKTQYLKTRANCLKRAEYYYSCECGKAGAEVFTFGDFGNHDFSIKSAIQKYLKEEATVRTAAIYYKSCKCGEAGSATFEYGDPIKLSDKQKLYLPMSVTVTLYDTLNNVYGFTYNSVNKPLSAVIQIKEIGDEEWTEFVPSSYQASSYDRSDNEIAYFVSEVAIKLSDNTSYVYRIGDKDADVYTVESVLKTKDPSIDSFTFVHVSDSQAGPGEFGRVLSSVYDSADFLIHTGDVVESSKYEDEWTQMLDGNYKYIMQTPIMAISGNHESTYKNGSYETDKHFYNNIPNQSSTALGYYYSFVYGNVKFIMLNTNDLEGNKLKAEQYNWLISELENNTATWTVVAMHNPMYSVGKYGVSEDKNAIAVALGEQLRGVFAQYGVDIVLQGHDHAISRTFPIDENGVAQYETVLTENGIEYVVDPNGVIYLMNGPAGSQSRAPVEVDENLYAYAGTSQKASWAEFTVDGDSLVITVKWHDGSNERVYYTWGIKKS